MIIGIHTKKEKRKERNNFYPLKAGPWESCSWKAGTVSDTGGWGGPDASPEPWTSELGGNMQTPLLSSLTLPLPLKQTLSIWKLGTIYQNLFILLRIRCINLNDKKKSWSRFIKWKMLSAPSPAAPPLTPNTLLSIHGMVFSLCVCCFLVCLFV